MPYFPYSDRDPSTGLFAGRTPIGALLDRVAQAVCNALDPITRWQAAFYRSVGIPGGASALLAGRPIYQGLCGGPAALRPVPALPGLPTFPVNCATFGIVKGRTLRSLGPPVQWSSIESDFSWTCSDNIGIPAGPWEWRNPAGSIWQWELPMFRPTGGITRIGPRTNLFENAPEKYQITQVSIQYCPSCGLPAPPPVPPTVPQLPDDPPVNNPPQITVNIDFPISGGLVPLVFPVIFSPVINLTPRINLSPNLTLAPRVDLNPSFEFAPTFEFSLGGITVTGGGYSEPRKDVEDLLECDCPDPCPPAGGEIDYDRIRQEGYQNLAVLRDLPEGRSDTVLGDSVTGENLTLSLPSGTIGVRYQLDLENYTGNVVIGGGPATDNYYAGWFWWGQDNFPGGDRQYFTAKSGFLPCPPFCRRFSCSVTKGAIVTITPVLVESPIQ